MKTLFFALSFLIFIGCNDTLNQRNHIVIGESNAIQSRFFPHEKRLELSYDKPFVLFFFSKGCGACKEAVPYLNAFAKTYKNSIEIIGILGGSILGDDDIKYLQQNGIDFKVISDPPSNDYFSKAVGGVSGVPLFVFFSKEGFEKKRYLGLVPEPLLKKTFTDLLENDFTDGSTVDSIKR